MSTATVIIDSTTGLPVVTFNWDALPETFALEQRPVRTRLGLHKVSALVVGGFDTAQAVFGTNQYGLTAWIFQRRVAGEARPPDASSYEELVPLVLQCSRLEQVRACLADAPLNEYAPHRLFVMDTTGSVHVYTGQGMHDPHSTVLNPQRFKPGVRVWASCYWSDRLAKPRIDRFHQWIRDGLQATPAGMQEFHANTDDVQHGTDLAGCGQVFVNRPSTGPGHPAAVTGAVYQVVYTPNGMRFHYWNTWHDDRPFSPTSFNPQRTFLRRID